MTTKEQRQLIEDKKCIEFLIKLHEWLLFNPSSTLSSESKDKIKLHIKELQTDLKMIERKVK